MKKFKISKLKREGIIKNKKFKKVIIKDIYDNETNFLKNKIVFYILIPFISLIIIAFIYLFLIHKDNLSTSHVGIKIIDKNYKIIETTDENTNFKIIQDFIYINYNGTLLYENKKFKKNENPKISIIITVHNGQAFIRSALRSVQNQDFQDIEIIIVDDDSKDDSVKIIKELTKEAPRIILISNDRNRGYLYSLINGVLNSKGKYVTFLDVDDLFSVENTLTTVYDEVEKYDLDMLGIGCYTRNIKYDYP